MSNLFRVELNNGPIYTRHESFVWQIIRLSINARQTIQMNCAKISRCMILPLACFCTFNTAKVRYLTKFVQKAANFVRWTLLTILFSIVTPACELIQAQEFCWQHWTMRAAEQCSILFSSILWTEHYFCMASVYFSLHISIHFSKILLSFILFSEQLCDELCRKISQDDSKANLETSRTTANAKWRPLNTWSKMTLLNKELLFYQNMQGIAQNAQWLHLIAHPGWTWFFQEHQLLKHLQDSWRIQMTKTLTSMLKQVNKKLNYFWEYMKC